MRKKINICDCCGKETKDYMAEKGWIHIDNCGLMITDGRKRNKEAKYKFYSPYIKSDSSKEFDFCSEECFLGFLKLHLQKRSKENKGRKR